MSKAIFPIPGFGFAGIKRIAFPILIIAAFFVWPVAAQTFVTNDRAPGTGSSIVTTVNNSKISSVIGPTDNLSSKSDFQRRIRRILRACLRR